MRLYCISYPFIDRLVRAVPTWQLCSDRRISFLLELIRQADSVFIRRIVRNGLARMQASSTFDT